MTAPAPVTLPGSGSTAWYSHYTRLDQLTKASAVGNANRVAFLGDSITSLNGTGDNVTTNEGSGDNYSTFLTTLSGGRMQWARSFATGGLTITEIRDTVLPRLLARPTAELPGTCVVLAGTNDITTSATLPASIAALTDIVTALRNAEIRAVLCTIPPRGDNSTAQTNANHLNTLITGLARKLGIPLIDFYSSVADTASGGWASGMVIGDNVHPSPAGMMKMAQAGIDSGILDWLPPFTPYLVRSVDDGADLLDGKGLFLTDNGSFAGFGAGWDLWAFNGATYSTVTPTVGDGCIGKWQRINRGTGSGYTILGMTVATSGVASVGDLISLDVRIRWSGISDSGVPTGGSGAPAVDLRFRTSGDVDLDVIANGSSRDITGVVHLERRVPATAAKMLFTVALPPPTTGTAVYDFGQVTMRNLTVLGQA